MKKIVVIGPESTGKSSLCEALAHHYHTLWCPEYAREYLLKNGTNYSYENLLDIAKGQIALEEDKMKKVEGRTKSSNSNLLSSQLLFIDTDMYVMKVWCEYVFGECHSFILEQIVERKYDLYLLCNTDLPWVKDELREYPDEKNRIELFNIYKDILINQNVPFAIVSGQGNERFESAVRFVDNFL
ncbi:MAG: AAA family ATPase [Arachidicoccus sp.]|nr:AAA family ATPase [Arachidicoccus sp.]